MGVGSGLYMYDFVVRRSRSLSHLLMSSCPFCARNTPVQVVVSIDLRSLLLHLRGLFVVQFYYHHHHHRSRQHHRHGRNHPSSPRLDDVARPRFAIVGRSPAENYSLFRTTERDKCCSGPNAVARADPVISEAWRRCERKGKH